MATNFNEYIETLGSISKNVIETNAVDLEKAFNQIAELTPNAIDINSPEMKKLYEQYQKIRKRFNSKSKNSKREIDRYKSYLKTNKDFSEMLNENDLYVPKKGKDLIEYKNAFLDKITEQENLINQSYEETLKSLNDIFNDTGYSVSEVKTHFKNQEKIMNKTINPYLDQLEEIKNNMMDLSNQSIDEIGEFNKGLKEKLEAEDISKTKIKKYTEEFNEWSTNYKTGEVATQLNDYNNKAKEINKILQNEMSSNYISEEMMNRYNDINDAINEVYEGVFGDNGHINEAAFEFNNNRMNANERINLKTTPVVEEVVDSQNTKNVIEHVSDDISKKDVKLVKGSRQHKLKNNPIENSTASKYKIMDDGEDYLIAHLKKKNGVELSPTDYLLGGKNPNSIKVKKTKMTTDDVSNFSAKSLLKKHGLNSIINIGATLIDYKESRREGDSVLKSATKAGINFAVGEALGGFGTIAFYAAGSLPSLAVKTAEGVSKMERQMNSVTRTQPFADVQFQDTQQLATMRQSGMEMAKMAQYNLQQTLMGNEATYMHR